MKLMLNYIYSLLGSCFILLTSFQSENVQVAVYQGLKNNDGKLIVKHFGSTVNLSLKGEERLSTKYQSELILTEFLKNNKIDSLKLLSNVGEKQANSYVMYEIKTQKKKFQVVVKFMEIKGETFIVEFKIY